MEEKQTAKVNSDGSAESLRRCTRLEDRMWGSEVNIFQVQEPLKVLSLQRHTGYAMTALLAKGALYCQMCFIILTTSAKLAICLKKCLSKMWFSSLLMLAHCLDDYQKLRSSTIALCWSKTTAFAQRETDSFVKMCFFKWSLKYGDDLGLSFES